MRHSTCRSLLLEGDRSAAVERHLVACAQCAAYAQRVAGVTSLAASLAPAEPPEGLAERVLAHVRAAATVPSPAAASAGARVPAAAPPLRGLPRLTVRPLRSRLLFATAAVGMAGVVALAAGLATHRGSPPSPSDVLLTAAHATTASGSAHIDLTGTASFAVTASRTARGTGGSAGPIPILPCSLAMGPSLATGTRDPSATPHYVFGGGGSECVGPSGQLPKGQALVSLRLSGSGDVRFPDEQHITGTVQSQSATAQGGPFELSVAGRDTWVRQPDSTWRTASGPMGPLGTLLLDARAVEELIARGEKVADLGAATIDGVAVHEYAFLSTMGSGGPTMNVYVVEAWVGDSDHRVHQLTASTDGVSDDGRVRSTWHASVTIRLHDFGAAPHLAVPPSSQVTGDLGFPSGPEILVYPLSGSVRLLLGLDLQGG